MEAGDGSILEAIDDLIGRLKGILSAEATERAFGLGKGDR
jgi:hypothetical protein